MKNTDFLSKTEIQSAVQWLQERLNIVDWTIHVYVSSEVPSWAREHIKDTVADVADTAGFAYSRANKKDALIWIALPADHRSQLETLFHEICHVAAVDVGIEDDEQDDPHVEYLWDRLSEIMADAYLAKRRG